MINAVNAGNCVTLLVLCCACWCGTSSTYAIQNYFGTDSSCSPSSQWQIQGRATNYCFENGANSYILLCDEEEGVITRINYDGHDCVPSSIADNATDALGVCVSAEVDDHRMLSCSSSLDPWSDVEQDAATALYFDDEDNTCSESVLTYIVDIIGVCHDYYNSDGTIISNSNEATSCTSDSATVKHYYGGDCKTFVDAETYDLPTGCGYFPPPRDSFAYIDGYTTFLCNDSSSSEDDDLGMIAIGFIVGASVLVVGVGVSGIAYWFGCCGCFWKQKEADSQLDGKLLE